MANPKNNKILIVSEINKALNKTLSHAAYYYKQFFLMKKLGKSAHEEALFYLINTFISEINKEKVSNARIEKIITFIAHSLYEYTEDNKFAIELLLKLKNLYPEYQAFKERNPNYKNENVDEMIESIDKGLKEIHPELNDTDITLSQKLNEKNQRLINEIEEKNKEIEKLKKELESLSKKVKKTDKYQDKAKEKQQEISKLETEIKNLKKEIKRIIKENSQKEQEQNTEANKYIEELEKYKEKEKKEILLKEQEEKKKDKETIIEEIIIDSLLKNNYKETDLLALLDQLGYQITKKELYTYLNNTIIKIKKLNYGNGVPTIGLNKKIETNQNLILNCEKEIKCIFISNINLTGNDADIYKSIENIYKYCKDNNINYVFILGNLFNILPQEMNAKELKNIEKIIKEILNNYPLDDSITNFILGGNNEIQYTNYGLDTLDIIGKERYDFYNLKYKNANVTINYLSNILNLHSKNVSDYNMLCEYINNYYSAKTMINPNSFDIISTTGNSIVDMSNHLVALPPLMDISKGSSIYHIDITLKDNDIKKISIYPMLNKQILIPTSHLYIYK